VRGRALLVCVAATALVGCTPTKRSSEPAQPAGARQTSVEQPKRVGVSLLKEDDEFYQVLKAAFQEAATKAGLEALIQSANGNLQRQTDQVDNFIAQKVDAIVLCPVDSSGVVGAVKRANAAGIPVFTADIAAKGGEVVSHIASDNRDGGRQVARKLAELLGGKGNVAIIGFPEVTSVADRVAGFREELAKHPGIKIVEEVSARGQRAEAQKAAQNLLLKHGRSLRALFGINDNTALGAQAAAEQAGRTDLVIVGYDGSREALESIRNPRKLLKADAVQYPEKIGAAAADAVARYLKGDRTLPRVIPVPCGVVDAASLNAKTAATP